MKRVVTGVAVLVPVVLAGILLYASLSAPPPRHVDGMKVLAAARAYAADREHRGLALPASVSVRELTERGLLTAADVSGFAGMEVMVSLSPGQRSLRDVLVRAHLSDGYDVILLADGSVHEVRRK